MNGYATRPKLIIWSRYIEKYIVVYALGSEYEWSRSRSYVVFCVRQALLYLEILPYTLHSNLPDQIDPDTISPSNCHLLYHLVRRMRGIERAVKYSFFSTSSSKSSSSLSSYIVFSWSVLWFSKHLNGRGRRILYPVAFYPVLFAQTSQRQQKQKNTGNVQFNLSTVQTSDIFILCYVIGTGLLVFSRIKQRLG